MSFHSNYLGHYFAANKTCDECFYNKHANLQNFILRACGLYYKHIMVIVSVDHRSHLYYRFVVTLALTIARVINCAHRLMLQIVTSPTILIHDHNIFKVQVIGVIFTTLNFHHNFQIVPLCYITLSLLVTNNLAYWAYS